MGLLKRWWVRILLYVAIIVVVAWSAYHVGYRQSFGPHPDESEADAAFFDGVVWAAGMSAIAMFMCAAVEGVLLLRRQSE